MRPAREVVRTQMRDAEAVLQQLDDKLEAITFDPVEPTSIEAATRRTIAAIDTLMAGFAGNPVLGPLAEQLKAQYLEGIRHRVIASQALQPAAPPTHSDIGMLAKVWGSFRGVR